MSPACQKFPPSACITKCVSFSAQYNFIRGRQLEGTYPCFFGFFRLGYNKFRSLNMELPMASSKAKAAPAIDLATKGCVPCKGGVPPIKGRELDGLIKHAGGWKAVSEHHITRTFTFPDFKTALEFTNRVGAIAEQQGHHPDIFLSWGKVEVTLYTHKIDGLTENDFILAARINKL